MRSNTLARKTPLLPPLAGSVTAIDFALSSAVFECRLGRDVRLRRTLGDAGADHGPCEVGIAARNELALLYEVGGLIAAEDNEIGGFTVSDPLDESAGRPVGGVDLVPSRLFELRG